MNRTLQLDVVIPAYEPVMNSGLIWLISRLKYKTIGYFSALLTGTFWVLLEVIFESHWRSFLTYMLVLLDSSCYGVFVTVVEALRHSAREPGITPDSHRTNTGLTFD